jgi:hypothetical protein
LFETLNAKVIQYYLTYLWLQSVFRSMMIL